MMQAKKQRSSNVELFRIICMILILMCHFEIFSGIQESLILNKPLLMYSYWGGAAGNAGFMIISGYFLDKFSFRIEKVLRLFFKVTIYNVGWFLVAASVFHYTLDLDSIVRSFLPTFYGAHEYAHVFMLMCFLSPFIRRVLEKADSGRLRKFIVIFGLFFMLVPYILLDSLSYMDMFTEFLFIYVFIYYLKKYERDKIKDKSFLIKSFLLSAGCMIGFSVICLMVRRFFPVMSNYSSYWAKSGSIFMVVAMASLFFLFLQWDLPQVKWINTLASTTFGVYLLHTPYAARTRMYVDFLHTDEWAMSYDFVIKYVLWIVIVFLVCAVIDLVVSRLFKMAEDKLLKNVLVKQRNSINKWMNS